MNDPNIPPHDRAWLPHMEDPTPQPAEPGPEDVPDLLPAVPPTDAERNSSSGPHAHDPTTAPPPTYMDDVWQEILMEIERIREIRLCLRAALVRLRTLTGRAILDLPPCTNDVQSPI